MQDYGYESMPRCILASCRGLRVLRLPLAPARVQQTARRVGDFGLLLPDGICT